MSSEELAYLYLLNVDLNELGQPHKLAQWIQYLPQYKKLDASSTTSTATPTQHQNPDLIDISICNSLSSLIYQQQITGSTFTNNFTKQDFENMMNVVKDKDIDKYNNYNTDWIWNMIQKSAGHGNQNITTPAAVDHDAYDDINTNTTAIKHKSKHSNKLSWMNSNWSRFQLIIQNDNVPNNIDNNDIKTDKNTQKQLHIQKNVIHDHDDCLVIKNCKSIKRLCEYLSFLELANKDIDDDNKLMIDYFKAHNDIYYDYKHIRNKHLNIQKERSDNLKTILKIINTYVKCGDITQCISYKNRNQNQRILLQNAIHNDTITDKNILNHSNQLLQHIHCYFMHFNVPSPVPSPSTNTNTNNSNTNHVVKEAQQHNKKKIKLKKKKKKQKKRQRIQQEERPVFPCFIMGNFC